MADDERSTTPLATLPAAAELNRADDVLLDMASLPSGGTENGAGGSRRPTTPPLPPVSLPSLSQDEEAGAPAERRKEEEELRNSKAKANLEAGSIAVVFGFTVLTALLCLPTDAKHVSDTCFTVVSLLLAFATSVSGSCLVFLSMAMIGLPRRLVSGVQRGASQCLVVLCSALSAMTLVSLLAFLPAIVLCVVGLAVFALSVAAAYWYGCTSRVALAGGDAAVATCREYKEEMEAAWKTASTVTNLASGGLVGVLPGAWNIAGTTTRPVTATYVSIFFMFSTAIIGMSAMTVSKRAVVDVATNRRFLVGAIRVTNAFLLCMLACAALAASYVVLGFLMLAAFAPLAIISLVFFLLRHCTPRRAGGRSGLLDDQPEPEARLKAMEDIASNVTAATLGGIMSILGWSLGQEDHRKAGPLDAVMVILTSAFVSGFGFMLLAAVPARARLAPAAKVLTGSCMVLIAATAVAVYGTEAWRI